MNAPARQIRYPLEKAPNPGQTAEIAEGVLWIRLPLPMALDHVNAYALDEGDSWTLVDTGISTRRSKKIWQDILAGSLAGKPVSRVIVTHHHPDHIGLAGWFQGEFGAELWTSRTAWLFARMLQLDDQERPVPETLEFWRSAGMGPEVLGKRAAERPFNYADCVAPMPLGFHRLAEGQTMQAGGRDWIVRLGNGHAPDHVTLWSTDGKLVIGGDQLLPSISPNLGVYATEPEADPVTVWMESCHRFRDFATDQQLVLPGHKRPFTGLPFRLEQLIDNHEGALNRLREHLRTPATAAECFMPLFKRSIDAGEYGLALVESVAHLNHLYQAGELTRQRRADGAWLWQWRGPLDGQRDTDNG